MFPYHDPPQRPHQMEQSTITNIGIADDHTLFREGITHIVNGHPNCNLALAAANGQELLDKLAVLQSSGKPLPHVLLVDLKMPVLDGMETTVQLRQQFPEIKILILTMLDQQDYITHLLNLGAHGYLLKDSTAGEVLRAIESVMQTGYYFSHKVSHAMLTGLQHKQRKPAALNPVLRITPRELEVLTLLGQECTTAEIAERLFVSTRTIETHRKHLMEKLGAKNTAGIIYRALKEGVLQ